MVAHKKSPPMRGRGSKLYIQVNTGVMSESPPMRGRGSKYSSERPASSGRESPPMRGRGSKSEMTEAEKMYLLVAPDEGAWV